MSPIRRGTKDDRAAILAVVREAFGSDEEVELVRTIWRSSGYLPELELVAILNDRVVGHVLHSRATVAEREVLALAPLAVTPAHQARGVGSSLVHEALHRADEAGYPMVVLLGHPKYYPRFGFEPAMTLGLTYADAPAPFPAFQARRLSAYDPTIRGRFRYVWEQP